MPKYDQRILKFLTQNADRTPTITDMMTRLNISISDISESLASLLEQKQIAKRINSQGIECWFPVQNASPALPSSPAFPDLAGTSSPSVASPTLQMDTRSFGTLSGIGSPMDRASSDRSIPMRPMPSPEIKPIGSKPEPVHVQHIQPSEKFKSQTQTFPARPATPSTGAFPSLPTFTQSAAKEVSLLTFAVGIVLAVVFSTWFSTTLAGNDIRKATKAILDNNAQTIARAATLDFQAKTKDNFLALEGQIKKLEDQLATLNAAYQNKDSALDANSNQGSSSSLKNSASTKAMSSTSKNVGGSAKTRAAQKAELAKAAKAAALAKATKAAKASKAAKAAKSAKATKESVSLAKASALKEKKKKSVNEMPKLGSYEYDNSGIIPSSTTSEVDDMPRVPEAPGINDQDLPPPPSE